MNLPPDERSDHPAETQREVYRRIFKTEGGKRIFRTMFAWEQQNEVIL